MEVEACAMKQVALYKSGNSLSYAEYGDKSGYPILVQHGLIASIDDFNLCDRLIALGTHLISIARPGYGASAPYVMKNLGEWAEIVSTLVDELKLSQFDVLGISSGAPYSYSIGYRFPDKVRNIYILSGIPALYDEQVLSHWPYPVTRNANIPQMEKLAYELFFSNLSKEELEKNDIRDSMMNNCFGIAQDLILRSRDWGFRLSDVKENVYMRHSRFDEAVPFITASLTSRLLPNCKLDVRESREHFSKDALDDFIKTVMAANFESDKRKIIV